jgi:beta-lactamase regulating signal transducer with metallopeptidase domain
MEELFICLLNRSITAGYVILAVILLRLFLKKAPKWISCALWALVGLRLLFSFSVQSVLSLIPSADTVTPDILYARSPAISSGISAVNEAVNPAMAESLAPAALASVNPMQIVMFAAAVIWIAGMLAMALYGVVTYLKLHAKVAAAVPMKENICQSDAVASPFVLGLIRPKIYLPFGTEEQSAAYVIAHEKAHIARKDHWIKPLGFLLLTVYWFNPLIWVAYILLCRDIELACDERVMREIGFEQKKAYSSALLASAVSRRSIAMCPLAFGEVGVRQRVKNVLHYKKPAFWIIVAALLSCAVLAVCFLTNPEKSGETVQTDSFRLVLPDGYRWSGGNDGATGNILKRNTVVGGVRVCEYTEPVTVKSYDSTHAFLSYIGLDPYHGETPVYMAGSSRYAAFNCSVSLPGGGEEQMHYFFNNGGGLWYDLWLDGSAVPQESWESFEAGMTLLPTGDSSNYAGFSVPEAVLEKAKETVRQRFDAESADFPSYGYTGWRIGALEEVYAYEEPDGWSAEVYRLNYELYTPAPEKVVLAGGMTVSEDGWVCPVSPYSTYIVYNAFDGVLIILYENDCAPGDETFTKDMYAAFGYEEPDVAPAVQSFLSNMYVAGSCLELQMTAGDDAWPAYRLDDAWWVDRFGVLLNGYDWELVLSVPAEETDGWRLDLSGEDACFSFYEDSPYVRYVYGENAVWYMAEPTDGDIGIAECIRMEYDGIEADYRNVSLTLPEERSQYSASEIAKLYLEAYLERFENLAPGSGYAVADYEIQNYSVFLPADGGIIHMIGISCQFAVCPEQYDFAGWWAGNTFAVDGKDGWLGMSRELRIEASDSSGQNWICTDMGTGGLVLGGVSIYSTIEVLEKADEYTYRDFDFRGYISSLEEERVSVDEIVWDTTGNYDNGYAIINDDNTLATYPLADACEFWLLENHWWPCVRTTWEGLQAYIRADTSDSVWTFRLNAAGEVVQIGYQYRP